MIRATLLTTATVGLLALTGIAAHAQLPTPHSPSSRVTVDGYTAVRVGDWGRGTPTDVEVMACQGFSGGEMIYAPAGVAGAPSDGAGVWTCEASAWREGQS